MNHIYGQCHTPNCHDCKVIADSQADDLFWDLDLITEVPC